jgi:hypothetical protein
LQRNEHPPLVNIAQLKKTLTKPRRSKPDRRSSDQRFYPWLEIECSRCKAKRDVDFAALRHVLTTFLHDLASRLVCQKCRKAGKRPAATLLQLTPRLRHAPE